MSQDAFGPNHSGSSSGDASSSTRKIGRRKHPIGHPPVSAVGSPSSGKKAKKITATTQSLGKIHLEPIVSASPQVSSLLPLRGRAQSQQTQSQRRTASRVNNGPRGKSPTIRTKSPGGRPRGRTVADAVGSSETRERKFRVKKFLGIFGLSLVLCFGQLELVQAQLDDAHEESYRHLIHGVMFVLSGYAIYVNMHSIFAMLAGLCLTLAPIGSQQILSHAATAKVVQIVPPVKLEHRNDPKGKPAVLPIVDLQQLLRSDVARLWNVAGGPRHNAISAFRRSVRFICDAGNDDGDLGERLSGYISFNKETKTIHFDVPSDRVIPDDEQKLHEKAIRKFLHMSFLGQMQIQREFLKHGIEWDELFVVVTVIPSRLEKAVEAVQQAVDINHIPTPDNANSKAEDGGSETAEPSTIMCDECHPEAAGSL